MQYEELKKYNSPKSERQSDLFKLCGGSISAGVSDFIPTSALRSRWLELSRRDRELQLHQLLDSIPYPYPT